MFVLALTFVEPDTIKRKSDNPLKDIFFIVKYSLGHTKILSIIILSSVVLITGITAIWGYLMIMDKHGISITVNGIGFALFQLTSAAGAITSHKISSAIGKKKSYALLSIIPLTMFMVGIIQTPLVLIFAFAHSFVWGFSFPFFMNELNNLIDSDRRATVLSTGSMYGRILFVFLSPLFGILSDKYSLGYGFLMLCAVFIISGGFSLFFGRKDFSIKV
jgi:MFS family permease